MSQRILVVDDEAHIVQVLQLKLRHAGYEVLSAADGEEGYELALRQPPPDLIITDFQMPYMTGLELCQQLASNPMTAGIPVLVLTARGYALDPEDLSIGNPPMIRAVLTKPFSPRVIVDQIQRVLAEKRCAGRSEKSEVSRQKPGVGAPLTSDLRPLTSDLRPLTSGPKEVA